MGGDDTNLPEIKDWGGLDGKQKCLVSAPHWGALDLIVETANIHALHRLCPPCVSTFSTLYTMKLNILANIKPQILHH